jgi:dipeptidyl aminopeptidase/acylaminoacyl peptidase
MPEHTLPARAEWSRPKLAPGGDRFAAVRRHGGAENVWVGASNAPMRLATDLGPWRLQDFHWSADGSGLVLELAPAASAECWVGWLDLPSGSVTRLTPQGAVDARYCGQSRAGKLCVMVATRDQRADGYELQAVTPTGTVMGHWAGPGRPVDRWLATATQAVAVCSDAGAVTWWLTSLPEPSWSPIAQIPAADADACRPVAFSTDGRRLFALSSAGRDTVGLVRMAAPSWLPETISAGDGHDIMSVLMAPDGTGVDLVNTTDPAAGQSALTTDAAADLARLRQVADGSWARIVGRNDSHFLAEIAYPVGGTAFVTVSRTTGSATRPLARYSSLERARIHCREPFVFTARDGRKVTGFLTQPDGPPPWPAVLVIHGGPWALDEAGTDPWAQALADAGLCSVQVNYRGSRGFGKQFRDAADKQWSLAMQDDLVDALRSAPVAAVVDQHRIAAMGHGYGGYAALMLATQQESEISCAVSASAPTDLVRFAGSLLSLGCEPAAKYAARIGDPFADRELLISASPVTRIEDFRAPLLMFHGRQDPLVPVSHAVMFADTLQAHGKQHELIVYEGEGHWYSRPQNVTDFQARSLEFLLDNLTCRANSAFG